MAQPPSSRLLSVREKISLVLKQRKELNRQLESLSREEKELLRLSPSSTDGLISASEVSKHSSPSDCWVILYNRVYDLTKFLDDHPGGRDIILRHAGMDATRSFEPFHPSGILDSLPKEYFIGELDPSTITTSITKDDEEDPTAAAPDGAEKPPLSHMLNLNDFAPHAQASMTKQGWAYYDSGAGDEETLRENRVAFQRLRLRPRVLVNVKDVDPSCSLLGYHSSFPCYVTATALGRLAHPEGEVVLTRAAGKAGIIQMCPTLASCSMDEMANARTSLDGPTQFFQLYVNADRDLTLKLVKRAEENGFKALCITVDAPQLGRRERDMKNKFTLGGSNVQRGTSVDKSQGVARALSSFIDASLCWADIDWFRSITRLPIVIKGIQCGEDAVLAAQHGVQGIVLSNHGGRQLDYARAAIDILPEVVAALRAHAPRHNMDIYVDGGVRRGTDVFKAIALGATAVGLGRPFLYAMASYGEEGVQRAMAMLREEFEMCMRLMGVTKLSQVRSNMVVRCAGHAHVEAAL